MDTITYLRDWANGHFELISTYKSEIHRRILETTVIDAFSQLYKKHKNKNQKEFADFLISFGGKYSNILKLVCPVILYYNEFTDKEELQISHDHCNIFAADNPVMLWEEQRLMALLEDKQKEKARIRYSYAGLIYQMRNKMSHELRTPNMQIDFHEDTEICVPYIAGENSRRDGERVFEKWTLNIPESFIVAVGKEAINNYLDDCERKNIDIDLSAEDCYLKWYD